MKDLSGWVVLDLNRRIPQSCECSGQEPVSDDHEGLVADLFNPWKMVMADDDNFCRNLVESERGKHSRHCIAESGKPCNPSRKGESQTRVETPIQEDRQRMGHKSMEKTCEPVTGQLVPMEDPNGMARDLKVYPIRDLDPLAYGPEFLASPQIVVSAEIQDPGLLRRSGESRQDFHGVIGYNAGIFKPKIKEVSNENQLGRLRGHLLNKLDEQPLPLGFTGLVAPSPEMRISHNDSPIRAHDHLPVRSNVAQALPTITASGPWRVGYHTAWVTKAQLRVTKVSIETFRAGKTP